LAGNTLRNSLRLLLVAAIAIAQGCFYAAGALVPALSSSDGGADMSAPVNQATVEAPDVDRLSATEARISIVVRGLAGDTALLAVETDAPVTSPAVASPATAPGGAAPHAEPAFRLATLVTASAGAEVVLLEGRTYLRVTTQPAGASVTVVWDLAADGVTSGALARVRVTQVDDDGAPLEGADDRAGVTPAPVPLGNDPPVVTIIAAAGVQGRTIVTSFTVADPFGDAVEVTLSVRDVDGGGEPIVVTSVLGAGGTVTALAAAPSGARGDIGWDSLAVFGVKNVSPCALLVTARDALGGVGTATALIEVRNDAPPSAQIISIGTASGVAPVEGRIPITFALFDPDADLDPSGPSGRPAVRIEVAQQGEAFRAPTGITLREGGVTLGIADLTALRARPFSPLAKDAENVHTFLWDARADGLGGVGAIDVRVRVTPLSGALEGVGDTTSARLGEAVSLFGPETMLAQFQVPSPIPPLSMFLAETYPRGRPYVLQFDGTAMLVFRTNGQGAFDQTTPVTAATFGPAGTGFNPVGGAPGDFNHDGYPDIVIVDRARSLLILIVQPVGLYIVGIPTDALPNAVAIGDVNGDGHEDLITAHEGAPGITLRLGTPAPPFFGAPTSVSSGRADIGGIALADLDEDGRLDLLVHRNTLLVHPGHGDGGFGAPRAFSMSNGSGGLAVGDIDRDGHVDVVVAKSFANRVDIRLGDGKGGFGALGSVPAGVLPGAVALGDIDLDGRLELIVGNQGATDLRLRRGAGGGGLGEEQTYVDPSGQHGIAAGDLDADGRADVASCSLSTNDVSIRTSLGGAELSTRTALPAGSLPIAQALGDIDGDGNLDMVVANNGSNDLSVRRGTGDGSFGAETRILAGTEPNHVALGDLDRDGLLDLVATNYGSNDLSVRRGNGDGTFGADARVAVGTQPSASALGDIDGDGDLDLAVTNQGTHDVSVRLGDGAGGFGAEARLPSRQTPGSPRLVDLDGDGHLDLLCVGYTSHDFAIRRGLGGGAFGGELVVAAGQFPAWLTVDDIDGDGLPEIVVGAQGTDDQRVFRRTFRTSGPVGRGDGIGMPVMLAPEVLPSRDGGESALLDLNGDGTRDLVSLTDSGPIAYISGSAAASRDAGVAGLPGARLLPVPALDLHAVSRTALPRDRRYAQASLAYAFSPEGTTLAAAVPVTIPLHARLTGRELSEGVIRVFAEERIAWGDAPRARTIDRRTGVHNLGRLREIARRDPSESPLPEGVLAATVSATAGTITFPVSRLERVQAFLEAPTDNAVLYRETFDGTAPFIDGIAPVPLGAFTVADWQGGIPYLNGRAITLPTATSAPCLFGTRLRRPKQESGFEGMQFPRWKLAPAPAGRKVYIRLRRAFQLTGPSDRVIFEAISGAFPNVHVIREWTGTSEGYPEMREELIEVPDAVIRTYLSVTGATPERGGDYDLPLRVFSDAQAAGAGFFLDDLEVIVAP